MLKALNTIKREGPECLAGLVAPDSTGTQLEAATRLIAEARSVGLDMRDYLTYKIDARLAANPERYIANDNKVLSGWEAALSYLNLPVRDSIEQGVMLQAAADTFQTFPGSRILFPQVVDDVARWKFRQTNFERIDPMLANSRTISAPEMISVVVDDKETDYTKPVRAIAEGGKIPISSIRASETAIKIWKFGMGYETTYEFNRRISLDILTPYVSRAERRIEMSKVWQATLMLINGDGVQGAAGVIAQSSFNSVCPVAATAGRISYLHLLAWLVSRAKAGAPIDTVVGNYDSYLQWIQMFGVPTTNNGETAAQSLERTGFVVRGVPLLNGTIDFVLSSAAPANQLVGYSVSDTMEQLTEAGSQISENEKAITNQTVTYVRTENSGFRLVFDGTRSIYNFGG